MVVGKTSNSLSIAELFEKYSEIQILTTVFPEITSIPCKINSPFRADNNPSFGIYLDNDHHVKFKDFGDPDCHGSLLDLLCKKWNCSFQQVFTKILEAMTAEAETSISLKPKQIKTFTRKEVETLSKIQVAVRPWKEYDYQYWASYGIEKQWLRYAEVYPISHKIVTKQGKKYIFPADKYAYVFIERKEGNLQLKIYQPFNTKGFKWCSKMDASVIGLWTKIPEYGDKVIICSSLKDALCISCQLHIPTLCLQGEGYGISDTAISELKRRYQKVYISFDTDIPGIQDSTRLAEHTGFINIIPDLGAEKDYSDYYKSLENKKDFQKLKSLFI